MNIYYQAQSEIEDITSKNFSFSVYHFKENCQKDFPHSEIVAMNYQTIEAPIFEDLKKIELNDKIVFEALKYLMKDNCYLSWEDLDENDKPIFSSDFAFCIIENNSNLPKLKLFTDKISELSLNDKESDSRGVKAYLDALLDLEAGIPFVFHYTD